MGKEIEVIIDTDSTLSVETHGIKGKSCIDALKFTQELGTVVKERKKPEFFDPEPAPKIKVR